LGAVADIGTTELVPKLTAQAMPAAVADAVDDQNAACGVLGKAVGSIAAWL